MSKLRSYRPTAPVVINLVALFIVLGGQAIAIRGRGRVKENDIAAGAVTARNLAQGIVTKTKLAPHAVTDAALDSKAIVGRTIKPASVHGLTLAGTTVSLTNIPDADPAGPMGSDGNWTTSGATATCPPDAMLLNGGIRIQTSVSHRAFVLSTSPSNSNASTWVGQISTDTGGASPGELLALCLR
jgi:hypothetical protein